MTISEINIFPLKNNNGLISFASCVLDGNIYLGDIAIYTSPTTPSGFRLAFPNSKVISNNKKIKVYHPINKETGEAIHKAIVSKYKGLMNKAEA